MRIVADTSVFLAVALEEPAKETIIEWTLGSELLAPNLLPYEMGNALSALLRRGKLRPEEVVSVWDALERISVTLCPVDIRAALAIVVRFGIYAYDAYFLACAMNTHCPLLTLDNGMKAVAQDLGLSLME